MRNLLLTLLAAGYLFCLLSSCKVSRHINKEQSHRDSTGSSVQTETSIHHTDSTATSTSDSDYQKITITLGQSQLNWNPGSILSGDTTGIRVLHGIFDTIVALPQGTVITIEKGHKTEVTRADTKTVDSSIHQQEQSSAVTEDKETKKVDVEKSSDIPWFGLIVLAGLLYVVIYWWEKKVKG